MPITNEELKIVKKILDLCRNAGVSTFECSFFKVQLSNDIRPYSSNRKKQKEEEEQEMQENNERSLTPEEMLFYSSSSVSSPPSYGLPESN